MELLFALIGRFLMYISGSRISVWLFEFLCSPRLYKDTDNFVIWWTLVWLIGKMLILAHKNQNQ